MSRAADVVRLSGDEYDRLMDEREILRQEAARAWREVDFIAKERTEHLEWRTKLANDLDECERHRDALAAALNKAEAENLQRGNVIGRITAHLLGNKNNVTDEDVVIAAAEVGRELQGAMERAERAEAEVARMKRVDDEATRLAIQVSDLKAECERNRKLLREWRSLFPGMSVEPGSLRDRTDSAMQEGK